jgi:hypothetical protein
MGGASPAARVVEAHASSWSAHTYFSFPASLVRTIGATLQAAATGAVKTIKMSAKLVARDIPTGTSGTQLRKADQLG